MKTISDKHIDIPFLKKAIEEKESYNKKDIEDRTKSFFQEIENYDNFEFQIELSNYVDCIWRLDKVLEQDIKNEREELYELRKLLLDEYNKSLERTKSKNIDVNKHFLYDKSKFYELIEKQKEEGFPLLKKKVKIFETQRLREQRNDFVARKNKAVDIVNKLTEKDKATVCISGEVTGENGGIGKTTLAIEIAHFFGNKSNNYKDNADLSKKLPHKKDYFKDGVIWVGISSTENNYHNIIKDIAQQMGYEYFFEKERKGVEKETKKVKTENNQKQVINRTNEEVFKDFNTENLSNNNLTPKELEETPINNNLKEYNIEDKNIEVKRREDIVGSLEEIALILYEKKVLIVIDNAEQNKNVFEYIFSRLNTFATILITSRYPTPGISNLIVLKNLGKEDSRKLFLNNLSDSQQLDLDCKNNKEYIYKLNYKLLEGHPLSIHLVAHSKKLFKVGIEDFSLRLKVEMQKEKRKAYKKISALLRVGDILSDEEKEALIRASANFKKNFTLDNVDGFCVHKNIKKSIQGLYSKSIISKDNADKAGEEFKEVQQVFKDYAIEELEKGYVKNIKNYLEKEINQNDNLVDFINKNIEPFVIREDYKLKNKQKKEFLYNSISILLYEKNKEENNDLSSEGNNTLEKNISKLLNDLLMILDGGKILSLVKTLLDSDYYESKDWLRYIEVHSYANQYKFIQLFNKASENIRELSLANSRFFINSILQSLSENYSEMGITCALDLAFSNIEQHLNSKWNLFNKYADFINSLINQNKDWIKCRLKEIQEKGNFLITKLSNDGQEKKYDFNRDLLILNAELSKKEISTKEIDELKDNAKEYNIEKYENDILYIEMLNDFHQNDYTKVNQQNNITDNPKLQRKITVLKILSLIKQNKVTKAINRLKESIKENELPKVEALLFLNYIKQFTDLSEHSSLIKKIGFKAYFKDEINNPNWLDIPKDSILIEEQRSFYDVDKMLLLDETFMLDKMDAIFKGEYHHEIKDFDTGFFLYPYIIDKDAVTEEEYKQYCIEIGKKYDSESFSIDDAIEYADAKGKKVATEEEWINAFRPLNYNTSIPQTISSLFEEETDISKTYKQIIKQTVSDSNDVDIIYKDLLPDNIYNVLINNDNWKDIVNQIDNIEGEDLQIKDIKVSIALLKLFAYSPNIYTPELKLKILEKLEGANHDYILSVYKLLLKDFCEFYIIDKKQMLLMLVNQRNIWKIAIKYHLNIETYNENLKFTHQIEMVHRIENKKNRATYKQATKEELHIKVSPKKGFVPFRCVKPLPLLADKIKIF